MLDYLDKRPEYHKVYRLRDETGHEFSDLLEVHIIELNKPLSGAGRMDDWIRLFNAKTEEELNMLEMSTKSSGILEAVKEVREKRLLKSIKALHEARLKEIRDRNARESYVRKEGIQQGLERGRDEGEDRLNRLNLRLITDNRYEDLERAAQDKAYREQLYKEYHL